jgi:hypothetical protein
MTLPEENARLREALEWIGNYQQPEDDWDEVACEMSHKAREALKGEK